LPWTDQPGPRPQRSEDQLFDAVRQRAGAIRRRRRAGMSASGGAMVAVLLLAFALLRTDDDGASELRVVGGETTTSSPVPPSTTMATMPSTTVPAPAPTTTRQTAAPTTRATVRTTTTVARTTTSTRPPPLRSCDPADVTVTATPDRATYPAGTTGSVLVAAANRSSRPCQPADPKVEFRNAAGAMVTVMSVTDIFSMGIEGQPPPSWDPGETLSVTMPLPGLYCDGTGALCPAGNYTATAVFGPFRSPPAAFTIT
jgi:hypothetical protein